MITPCIKICQLDPKLEYCIGCKRTVQEITDWSKLSDKEKQQVLDRIKGQ